MTDPKLRIFLCHASQDKPLVRDLYQRLHAEVWIDPWLDEEKLLPGQDWDLEIEKAVETADVVIVCVSNRSVTKEGYVQKEIRRVLDSAFEKPEETIFIIPLRLDDCELPRRLRAWQYVDYFPADQQERTYQKLMKSLDLRHKQLQSHHINALLVEDHDSGDKQKNTSVKNVIDPVPARLPYIEQANIDTVSSIALIVYFVLAAIDSFTSSNDVQEFLLGTSAIFAGIMLVWRRQIPAGTIFKISSTLYLLLYGLGYRLESFLIPLLYAFGLRLEDVIPDVLYAMAGVAATAACIMAAKAVRAPKKTLLYASISFAVFLFFLGIYELVTNFNYSAFTNTVDVLILITSIVTSVLLWLDL